MPMMSLAAEDVRRVRETLGWSREELATRLDVSTEAVKTWEDGTRNCSGPARLLLMLLERSPNILTLLEAEPDRLPSPNAIPRSPAWFKLQRLLFLIGPGMDYGYWCSLYADENFNEEWLWKLEQAGLLTRNPRNAQIRRVSGVAETKFNAGAWVRWR